MLVHGALPGENGPEACKDVPMGERIRAFLSAVLAGAKDAGRKVEVVFRPYHFGRDEVYDVIRRMPKGTRPSFDTGLYPSTPFVDREHLDYLKKAKEPDGRGCCSATRRCRTP